MRMTLLDEVYLGMSVIREAVHDFVKQQLTSPMLLCKTGFDHRLNPSR